MPSLMETNASLSYTSSWTSSGLAQFTVKDLLTDKLEKCPNKIAYIFNSNTDTSSSSLTFSTIKTKSFMLAQNLLNLGLNKGGRIGLLLPNTQEFVLSYFASALIGTLNYKSMSLEFQFMS
jgi:acyl-CoA synthetase (AMP-forming)/AMP-acid ligase II